MGGALGRRHQRAKRCRPVEADLLHRLILRSLHGADHRYIVLDPARPWAASLTCSLCDEPACVDSARGLFDSCRVTAAIWDAMGIGGRQPLTDDLVLPPARGKVSLERLQALAIFVHAVWKERTRRRFGYTAPAPVNVRAVADRARARIGRIERVDEDVPDSDIEA